MKNSELIRIKPDLKLFEDETVLIGFKDCEGVETLIRDCPHF